MKNWAAGGGVILSRGGVQEGRREEWEITTTHHDSSIAEKIFRSLRSIRFQCEPDETAFSVPVVGDIIGGPANGFIEKGQTPHVPVVPVGGRMLASLYFAVWRVGIVEGFGIGEGDRRGKEEGKEGRKEMGETRYINYRKIT